MNQINPNEDKAIQALENLVIEEEPGEIPASRINVRSIVFFLTGVFVLWLIFAIVTPFMPLDDILAPVAFATIYGLVYATFKYFFGIRLFMKK